MMSLWDALRMNMMISYQELVRTFPSCPRCHSKMVRRMSNGNYFYGCSAYPICKGTRNL
ncbi:topoisomerase DNA-binding C4 zinc finger domain-containing protein [Citrobacter portucalensis]|uniref:topoisomerase DNA-binding C4 zinc finger domain-containing protein n=1 Tax=Citrobacter portucalensis TaxID=1639133 RepID=UPI0015E9D16B|nr:topoisomerase DNA-binding C4 zinc finger domain-containing protein [Citrobacter sp. RHBSTW-00887]